MCELELKQKENFFYGNLLGKTPAHVKIPPPQMPRQRKGPRILRTDPIGLDTAVCIEEGDSGITFPIFEKVRLLRRSFFCLIVEDFLFLSWKAFSLKNEKKHAMPWRTSSWRTRRL